MEVVEVESPLRVGRGHTQELQSLLCEVFSSHTSRKSWSGTVVSGQLLGGELEGGTGRECGWMELYVQCAFSRGNKPENREHCGHVAIKN